MLRLSKVFYVGSIAACGLLIFVLVIIGVLKGSGGNSGSGLLYIGLAFIPVLFIGVVFSFLIYKMWEAIQDGHARTTPGKALGYLFIPFFNFYWVFQALLGFAKDYNNYISRHKIDTLPLPEAIFLIYIILCFTAWIPILGMILSGFNFIVGLGMIWKICDAVNVLPNSSPAA